MVMLEPLESRRLMSGTITANVAGDGTLEVKGTLDADTIDISETGGVVTVVANGDADNPIFFGAATPSRFSSAGLSPASSAGRFFRGWSSSPSGARAVNT